MSKNLKKVNVEKDETIIDEMSVMSLKGIFKKIFLDDLKKDIEEKNKNLHQELNDIKVLEKSNKKKLTDLPDFVDKFQLKPLELDRFINPDNTNSTVLGSDSNINDVIIAYLEYNQRQQRIVEQMQREALNDFLIKSEESVKEKVGTLIEKLNDNERIYINYHKKIEESDLKIRNLIEEENYNNRQLVDTKIASIVKHIEDIEERNKRNQLVQTEERAKIKQLVYIVGAIGVLIICLQIYQLLLK